MKNDKQKVPTDITFSIDQFRKLPDEVLGQLLLDRLIALEYPFPEKVKIEWREETPTTRLAAWFLTLPPASFASFFEATTWPPKVEKKEAKPRAPKKTARTGPASRSKPKPKAKPTTKTKSPAKPRAKQAELFKQPPAKKPAPKSPRQATGDELAGDVNLRDALLAFVRGAPEGVTAAAIQEHLILSPGQTKGLLKRMREQGGIRVEGKNRGAKYFAGAGKAKGKDEEE